VDLGASVGGDWGHRPRVLRGLGIPWEQGREGGLAQRLVVG
jgi:hypothetical protein